MPFAWTWLPGDHGGGRVARLAVATAAMYSCITLTDEVIVRVLFDRNVQLASRPLAHVVGGWLVEGLELQDALNCSVAFR